MAHLLGHIARPVSVPVTSFFIVQLPTWAARVTITKLLDLVLNPGDPLKTAVMCTGRLPRAVRRTIRLDGCKCYLPSSSILNSLE
jgi:hypothetical protein